MYCAVLFLVNTINQRLYLYSTMDCTALKKWLVRDLNLAYVEVVAHYQNMNCISTMPEKDIPVSTAYCNSLFYYSSRTTYHLNILLTQGHISYLMLVAQTWYLWRVDTLMFIAPSSYSPNFILLSLYQVTSHDTTLNHTTLHLTTSHHTIPHRTDTVVLRPLLWTNGPSPGLLFWPVEPGTMLSDGLKHNWMHHKRPQGNIITFR